MPYIEYYMTSAKEAKKINALHPAKKIELIFSGEKISRHIYASNKTSLWRDLENGKKNLEYKEFLIELAKQNKKLFEEVKTVDFFNNNIFYYKNYILRPTHTRKASKSNISKSLLNHLFVNYQVPQFLYQIKSKHNRLAYQYDEYNLILKWAKQYNFNISKWIKTQ